MTIRSRRHPCSLALFLLALTLPGCGRDEGTARPGLRVLPRELTAGETARIDLLFTTADPGIGPGGGIQIELPVPGDRSFGKKVASVLMEPPREEDIELETSSSASLSLDREEDGSLPRRLLGIRIQDGALRPGDEVRLTWTTRQRAIAGTLAFKYRTRTDNEAPWVLAPRDDWPALRLLGGDPAFVRLVAPADVVVGEPFDLRIMWQDRFGNLARRRSACEIALSSTDPSIRGLLDRYSAGPVAAGKDTIHDLAYGTPGLHRIRGEVKGLPVSTHATMVHAEAPRYRRLFGDTQFHTGTGTGFAWRDPGGDHYGNVTRADEAYTFAREVACLDFASLSEHDLGMTREGWKAVRAISESHHAPGKFTTLFAWEYTPEPSRHAHQVILSPDPELPFLPAGTAPTPERLWAELARFSVEVLALPHPMFSERMREDHNPIFDRDKVNERFQKVGEIYSHHAKDTSGWLGPLEDDPAIFERGADRSCSFQHAWKSGLRLGVIGSSDNHLQTPGVEDLTSKVRHGGGLAVVLAEKNDRREVFDALVARRCYATTGPRIYLDLEVEGAPMGSEITVERGENVTVRLLAGGTDVLDAVEVVVLRNEEFTTALSAHPGSDVFRTEITLDVVAPLMVYLRVRQRERILDGARIPGAMAFSSPVWIDVR